MQFMTRLSCKFPALLLGMTLCGSGLAALAQAPAQQSAQRPPNIVVLVADDLGYSDVGAFGSEIATPNIDALAKRGTKFANFHTAASCSPTRAMLLTGVDNHRTGVGNMAETLPAEHMGKPGYEGHLTDRAVTVAAQLRDHGYHTYVAGKWHLGKTPETLPGRRGFERSFVQLDSGSDNWEQRTYVPVYDKALWFEQDKEATLPKDFYSSRFIVDKTIDYIDAGRKDGKPFFAYLAFQAIHIPIQAPEEFIAPYRGRYAAGWSALRTARRARAIELGLVPKDAGMVTMASTEDWNALSDEEKRFQAQRMEVYAGMASAMDHEIGRLIAHLKQSGDYDNTLFVFLSDNGAEPTDPLKIFPIDQWIKSQYVTRGENLGGKGTYLTLGPSWASAAVAPLSGYKFWAGEGGLRVPLIVAGPGLEAGRTTGTFSFVTDIAPTLLGAAGIAQHDGNYAGRAVERIDGRSLMPLLQGQAERAHPADKAVGYELSGNAALFKGDYKLVRNMAPVGDGAWHLYNLATDPGEAHDLGKAEPQRFAEMQADYAAYVKANGVLDMPEGYSYVRRGMIYGFKHAVLPKLLATLPWLLAALALLVGMVVAWRRR